jgi:hypothetical protein
VAWAVVASYRPPSQQKHLSDMTNQPSGPGGPAKHNVGLAERGDSLFISTEKPSVVLPLAIMRRAPQISRREGGTIDAMATSILRVVPDGVLIDHVAEFVHEPTDRVQALFSYDEEGYIDAVWKLVQTISVGGHIVVSEQSGKSKSTDSIKNSDKLKNDLANYGRLDFAKLFREDQRSQRLTDANEKLNQYWDAICSELDDPTSEVSNAFLGQMLREFHYFGLQTPEWYSRDDESKILPPRIKKRISCELMVLATQHGIEQPEGMFWNWIEQNATTHYRIFLEYLLFLGVGAGEEYLPALTRSSLRFITQLPKASVREVVLPFVALEAIKKVKQRRDLIPRVTEWTEGAGRPVVEGFKELQSVVRSTRAAEREKRILRSVEHALSSAFPPQFHIALNLLKFGSTAEKGEVDVAAAENIARLAWSSSYRWLWSIRSAELKEQWRKKIRELSLSPL